MKNIVSFSFIIQKKILSVMKEQGLTVLEAVERFGVGVVGKTCDFG